MNEREFKFDTTDFKALKQIVYDRTGIHLRDNKEQMVYTRLARRIRALSLTNFKDYRDYLLSKEGEAEISDFVNAITTNLTRFFREAHHFQHLRHEVLKTRVEGSRKGHNDKDIRIWSAGCSKGMEPYTIAMTVKASLPRGQGWYTRILATDIDTNMLQVGREGVYGFNEAEGIPAALERRFVKRADGKAYMSQELKDMIHFKHLNLMEKWPIKTKFNAIFCRNVMIYFDHETQHRLVDRFIDLLEDDGVLYVGHAEAMVAQNPRLYSVGRSTFMVKDSMKVSA